MGKLTKIVAEGGHIPSRPLIEICDGLNRHPLTERMGVWYYVEGERIHKVDGCEGGNIHRTLQGETLEFVQWDNARMNGYRRWIEAKIAAGLVNVPAIGGGR